LALSGVTIGGRQAVAWGLADGYVESQQLPKLWAKLAQTPLETGDAAEHWIATQYIANYAHLPSERGQIDQIFSLATVEAMLSALDAIAASGDDTIASTSPHHGAQWASQTATALRKRSPLLLKVTLAQIRKGRAQGLADTLRMERDMVYHCFRHRPGAASETMEGIRAQVIDKDLQPRWNPATLAEVSKEAVNAFFASPWPAQQHPLAALHR
jgi:enoyl-CoA hydratase/carnithine racemase